MKDNFLSERIIFALDCADTKQAYAWIDKLWPEIRFFKIGLELFLASGWPLLEHIRRKGGGVMLDLKFFDIPATVAKAVHQCTGKGITFITIHGNKQTVAAAMDGKGEDSMKILAVTFLTSQMKGEGHSKQNAEEIVIERARECVGCDGLISSPLEVAALRKEFGPDPILVTPGIRDSDDPPDDQERIANAEAAISAGSDYLVIGRPIRLAREPLKKIKHIKEAIAAAL